MTGAYSAVVYIKENMNLSATTASEKDSKEVVRICTVYAQKGMWNIFIVVFCFALALPFFNPYFFIGYLIGIAFFGLFQAIFMANAGGAWDNAKKIVEVDLRQKGTELHAATVVGDTVGDPFKDTSSVAMNPDGSFLVAWTSTGGETEHAGVVTFHKLSDTSTRVTVQLDWEPEGFMEKVGSLVGVGSHAVKKDLKNFKEFIENRPVETGAWRGDVEA